MGSPYFVHKQANRIHVVRTVVGFQRILKTVMRSMGMHDDLSTIKSRECSPEYRVLEDLYLAYQEAAKSCSRNVVFLESRYEWTGWEKFQRVIIFDFSGERKEIPFETLEVIFPAS